MNEEQGTKQAQDTEHNISLIATAENEASQKIEETPKRDKPGKTNEPYADKPSFFQRFMHKHFPDAKAHDRWTLAFTSVIALSTFLYMVFAGWTLVEIHSGSADTHNLAVAAKVQADAAKAQVEPIIHLQSWMGMFRLEQSNRIFFVIKWQNDGKTWAEDIAIAPKLGLFNSAPIQSQYEFTLSDFKTGQHKSLPPFDSSKQGDQIFQYVDASIPPTSYPILVQQMPISMHGD